MKCLWVFVISLLPLVILNGLNYWQIKHVEPGWGQWLWFTIKWFPAFVVAQVLIYWVWSCGFHRFCGGQIWVVWLLWMVATVFVAMVMAKEGCSRRIHSVLYRGSHCQRLAVG